MPYDKYQNYSYSYQFSFEPLKTFRDTVSVTSWYGHDRDPYCGSDNGPRFFSGTRKSITNISATFNRDYSNIRGAAILFDAGVVVKQGQTDNINRISQVVNIPFIDYEDNYQYKTIDVSKLDNILYEGIDNYQTFRISELNKQPEISYYHDRFVFQSHSKEIYNEDGRRFKINYRISYTNSLLGNKLSVEKAYFKFLDKYDLYPKIINIDENGYKIIELETSGTNSIYDFKPKDKLYVNKTSLELSNTKLDNYLETDSLYFPIGHYDELKTMDIRFEFIGVTPNKYNIIHPFTLYNSYGPVGNSTNGEHYVSSDIAKTVDTSYVDPIIL